jgi:hypothetical protein
VHIRKSGYYYQQKELIVIKCAQWSLKAVDAVLLQKAAFETILDFNAGYIRQAEHKG